MNQLNRIPRLLVTSVIRGNQQHHSQGGLFLIDMEQQAVNLVLDWNTIDIDWTGRGFEKGLRAIVIDGETMYLAAGDELFAYSLASEPLGSWRNPYLKHCRSMAVHERKLFLLSAGFDCVLAFDLDKKTFDWAMHIDTKQFRFKGAPFDPAGEDGPLPLNKLELTDIYCGTGGMYLNGQNTHGLLLFNGSSIEMTAKLGDHCYNAQPFRKGVLFIDNELSALRYSGRENRSEDRSLPLPVHNPDDLQHEESDFSGVAKPGFGRGLCVINDRAVAVGTSPSTIHLYDLRENRHLFSVNLSRDVRTAIHDIALWPF